MVKTFLVAALLAAQVDQAEGKVRPLHPAVGETSNPLVKSHERRVRNYLVKAPRTCSAKEGEGALVESSHGHPTVQAGRCQTQCLFQDDQNEWCFSTTAPMLTTGWNFTQNSGTNFWQVKFQPYFQT